MAFQVPIRRGEQHPLSKLSDRERHRCREAFLTGATTITDLAHQHGVARQTMSRIVHRPADFLSPSASKKQLTNGRPQQ